MPKGFIRYHLLFVAVILTGLNADTFGADQRQCLNYTRLQILQLALPSDLAEQSRDSSCQRHTAINYHCIPGVTSRPSYSIQTVLPTRENLRVVSIGEGYSGLVDYLRHDHVPAIGIDFDEGYRTKVDPLLHQHPSYYSWGDATQLSSHSYVREAPLDLLLSHCMLCSMPHEMAQAALVQAAQSIAVGGEARFSYFPHGAMEHDTAFLGNLLRRVALEVSLQNLNIEINVAEVQLFFSNDSVSRTVRLIRLVRHPDGGPAPDRQQSCSPESVLGEAPMDLTPTTSKGEACETKVSATF